MRLFMDSLTFKEAAILVLNDAENPLDAREIWTRVEDRNLVTSEAKQPWNVLYNTIIKYSDRNLRSHEGEVLFHVIEGDTTRFELAAKQQTDVLLKVISPELDWKQIEVKERSGRMFYDVTDCPEYTYFIYDSAHAAIKIGRTTNCPEDRLATFKTANPGLELMHVVPADVYAEADLHDQFEEFRKDREWFFATKSLERFIQDEKQKSELVWEAYQAFQKHSQIINQLLDILS